MQPDQRAERYLESEQITATAQPANPARGVRGRPIKLPRPPRPESTK